MIVRITTVAGEMTTAIRVEGRLTAGNMADLQSELQAAGTPVELDLSGLISADAEGVRLLRALSAKGAKLPGLSAHIRQLLDTTPS